MKLLISSVLGSALLASGIAQAGEVVTANRTQYFNAPAHCQGALPNFEGSLRKRPLALQNEGATSAYVTCAIPTQGRVEALEMYASSHDGSASEVTCTAVTGYKGGTNLYVPQTVVTSADGDWTGLVWEAEDFQSVDVFPSSYIALSCNLAPGTGLNDFWLYYSEVIG